MIPVLSPGTAEVSPSRGGLAPDLVHSAVVRTPGGAEFAVGWVDDVPAQPDRPEPGAERQKES
jgi:hypothetical protein